MLQEPVHTKARWFWSRVNSADIASRLKQDVILLAATMEPHLPFWEQAEVVEMFASRPPDKRMIELLNAAPRSTRVLDLGCAAGRNTEWLAQQGFDFYAVDTSQAMLTHTQNRVRPYVGEQTKQRVLDAAMDSLGAFEASFFDLVICFGVYHAAQSMEEWHRALGETARVLKAGGQLLMTQFSPRSDPTGQGLRQVEPHLFMGFRGERIMLLLEPDELDAWMAQHQLLPVKPTSDVTAPADEGGTRVVVNALYRKH